MTEYDIDLQKALDAIPDSFVVFDTEGKPIMWNRAFREHTAYEDDEIGRMRAPDFFSQEDVSYVQNSFSEVLRSQQRMFITATIVTKDGRRVPSRLSGAPLADKKGNTVALCGVGRDITDQKRAEATLRNVIRDTNQRREEITALLQSTRQVLEHASFEESGREVFDVCLKLIGADIGYLSLLDVNQQAGEILFFEPESLLPSMEPMLKMPVSSYGEEAIRSNKAVFDNDFESSRWAEPLPEGHVPIDSVLFAPLTVQGKARGLIVLANKPGGFTGRDSLMASAFAEIASVALRNSLTLQELESSEERYRRLVETAPEVIYVLDRRGVLTSLNPTFANITGWKSEEWVGKEFAPLIHPDDLPTALETFQQCLAGESPPPYELRIRTSGGGYRVGEFTSGPHVVEGEILGEQGIVRDVTDRKEAQRKLWESLRRFEDIAESTREWIWEVDADGKYTYSSPMVEKILGYTPAEVTGKHFYDLFHPEERDELKRKAFEVFDTKETFNDFVNLNLSKDGKAVWMSTSGVPILDEENNLLGYRGADYDITERLESRKALEESEEMYRSVTEAAFEGFLIHRKGTILEASDELLKMFGYERSEVLGTSMFDYIAPDYVDKAMKGMSSADEIPYELMGLRKDGVHFYIETCGADVTYHGEKARVVAVRDIDERKRAEEALQESEEQFRQLSEAAYEGILIHSRGKILVANSRAGEILGCDSSELIGRNGLDFVAPQYRNMVRARIEEESTEPYDVMLQRKDGSIIDAAIQVRNISYEGLPARVTTFHDITYRKEVERELQKLNIELEGYAHAVSHDLKGPLSSMMAASLTLDEIVQAGTEHEAVDEIRELTGLIADNVRKANSLIEDMLALAEVGQKPIEVTDVDVSAAVDRVLGERAGQIMERGVKLEVDPDLGRIRANATQVYQLFSNLVGNALIHSDSKSPVVVVSNLGLDEQGRHRYLIRDNGSGFDEAELENIFKPFYSSKKDRAGLGLTMVERIIQVYDGYIRAYNDNGACFEFAIRDARSPAS